jgi:[acyl-carrier-protein] S-malonyltransferase
MLQRNSTGLGNSIDLFGRQNIRFLTFLDGCLVADNFMRKTAILFAGQGAQVVGMGKDFASKFPSAKALFEQANTTLHYDLTRLCFEGPEAELTQTEHAQPGIYLVSWVAFHLLRELLPALSFEAAAGLSLGEFTALAAAGAFSFEDGLRLVRQRDRFMQEACEATRGSMAAIIGLEEGPTREVCAEAGVELANLNCPGQLVISGETERITKACALAKTRGAKRALPLPVAGAYHSRLMASAQTKLDAAIAGIGFRCPRVPVVANVTARPHGTVAQMRELVIQQVTAPVRWEDSMRYLLGQGFDCFVELGPGSALTGFMKRIDKNAQILNVADGPSLEAAVKMLAS